MSRDIFSMFDKESDNFSICLDVDGVKVVFDKCIRKPFLRCLFEILSKASNDKDKTIKRHDITPMVKHAMMIVAEKIVPELSNRRIHMIWGMMAANDVDDYYPSIQKYVERNIRRRYNHKFYIICITWVFYTIVLWAKAAYRSTDVCLTKIRDQTIISCKNAKAL